MIVIILDICGSLTINPVPLVIFPVLAANIGSASTVQDNPIAVLIAIRGGVKEFSSSEKMTDER
ncbi:MAG: hypothetical protein K8F52_17295 [Candidatus Scalindua rubra]|nr:hypothetical protein [Candidatus Scalindua rubra]